MSSPAIHIAPQEFEQLYIRLRQKEGRVYSDEEVAALPYIDKTHPHFKEWLIRKRSCKALVSYIKQKETFMNVLEAGCGNGWLSAKLASEVDVNVTGLDINIKELEQANRVFSRIPNVKFLPESLQSGFLGDEKFDMIIFAASIQYFSSLKQVIGHAIEHLTLQGEVHIMDSPFYLQSEIDAARQRTKAYYRSMGFTGMTDHYYHHTLNELDIFQYKILHHPHSWKNKLSIKKNPFYWIVIKNRYS